MDDIEFGVHDIQPMVEPRARFDLNITSYAFSWRGHASTAGA
jgi:hypothetical protein